MSLTTSPRRSASCASAASRRRWRFAWSTACSAVAALALGACGGSGPEEAAPPAQLPAEVGSLLASETEEVTAALEQGDPERAYAEATELRAAANEAVESGRVPPPLRAPLLAAVERLVASLEVPAAPPVPPPPPPPPPPNDEEDKSEDKDEDKNEEDAEGGKGDKGKGDKGKGKDKGGDDR